MFLAGADKNTMASRLPQNIDVKASTQSWAVQREGEEEFKSTVPVKNGGYCNVGDEDTIDGTAARQFVTDLYKEVRQKEHKQIQATLAKSTRAFVDTKEQGKKELL